MGCVNATLAKRRLNPTYLRLSEEEFIKLNHLIMITNLRPIDIMKMPVKDLRAALAQRGLETKGLKKVLQKRLLDALGVPEGASLEFKES